MNTNRKTEVLNGINTTGVVAIIRADDASLLIDVARALHEGGVRCIEITMTTPGALEVIRTCRKALDGSSFIGAGTVMTAEDAAAAMDVGAEFIVSPVTRPEVVAFCRERGISVMPGALTPGEIVTAHELGADIVKVFSVRCGGAGYIRDLKGPLPQIELIPTGGINLNNAGDFIKAGACALGMGGALIEKEAVQHRDFSRITRNAQSLIETVAQARQIQQEKRP